jgi:hypothetical protein
MNLAKFYYKEIAKRMQHLPVYLPGRNLKLGDIIEYSGRKPIGDPNLVNSLENLGIPFSVRTDPNPESYRFSSLKTSTSKFVADANVADGITGKLEISFNSAGSVYVAALNMRSHHIENLNNLEPFLANTKKDKDFWQRVYIVTGLWIAEKAIVMQSNSANAKLELTGKVKELDPELPKLPTGEVSVSFAQSTDAAFFKDWSDNVEILLSLAQFKPKQERLTYDKKRQDDSDSFEPVIIDDSLFEEI